MLQPILEDLQVHSFFISLVPLINLKSSFTLILGYGSLGLQSEEIKINFIIIYEAHGIMKLGNKGFSV